MDPGVGLRGRGALLGRREGERAHAEEHDGDAVERPALAAVARHASERVQQRRRPENDEQRLGEARQRRGVLVRHRRVDVEEAAAHRAQRLDRLPRRHRPDRVAGDALRGALSQEEQRAEGADGKDHVQQPADQVDPEVAQARAAAAPHEAADHGDPDRQADGHREQGLQGDDRHLREEREARLARVELPARVRHERHGRVERDVPRHGAEVVGVQRVSGLEAQQPVGRERAHGAEDHHGHGVIAPRLVLGGVDLQQPVEAAFDRAERALQRYSAAAEHALHVGAQRNGERRQHYEKRPDLDGGVDHACGPG
jgi:hypothetical protein